MATASRLTPVIMSLLLAASTLCGCGKDHYCDVPIGDATCQIDPNSPLYPGLNMVGSYQYLIGGYQGIVVIRTTMFKLDEGGEFLAYECTCPHDHGRLAMDKDYGNLVLRCPLCGSGFSTFGDGFPLDGSLTSCPLYHYNTYYDGAILYISTY